MGAAMQRQSDIPPSAMGRHEDRPCGSRLLVARRRARGFTLIELMITVMLMGIAAAMVIPAINSTDSTHLAAGVSLMIADMDFAQTMAINVPAEKVLLRFDPDNARWWVAPQSAPNQPYLHLYTNDPYDTTMGAGRAMSAIGVTFTVVDMEKVISDYQIAYDAFGALDQTTNPQIVLTSGDFSSTITIDAEIGFLTAQ